VMAAEVAVESFGHQVLVDGPGHGGQAEGEDQAAGEDSGIGVAAGVVEGVVDEISPRGAEQREQSQAEVEILFHERPRVLAATMHVMIERFLSFADRVERVGAGCQGEGKWDCSSRSSLAFVAGRR
jgi:hypothetical protein